MSKDFLKDVSDFYDNLSSSPKARNSTKKDLIVRNTVKNLKSISRFQF